MSGGVSTTTTSTIAGTIQAWAGKAFAFLEGIGDDWARIKADPIFGPLAQAAVTAAQAELTAQGIPVVGMTNLALAMESALAAHAAASPKVATP